MKRSIIMTLIVVFLTSCTGMLWDRDEYTEKLHSLYIDEENDSFVVLGESYHYIFKAEKELINILKASKNIKMHSNFYYFDLSSDNTVTGSFDLSSSKSDLTKNEVFQLKSLGFDDSGSYNREQLRFEASITGIRYKVNPQQEYGRNLSKVYFIKVLKPRSDGAAKTTGKILLTPVTVAADVVLGFLGGILYGITFH